MMKKRIFLLFVSFLMTGLLCGFMIPVPDEWLGRDPDFSIPLPSSEIGQDSSIPSGLEDYGSIIVVPIPDEGRSEIGGQIFVVPIEPEDGDSKNGIFNIVPLSEYSRDKTEASFEMPSPAGWGSGGKAE